MIINDLEFNPNLFLDIECVKELPEIPTHSEYEDFLEQDDGRVVMQAKIYPAGIFRSN